MKSFVPVAGVDVSKRFSDLCVLSPQNDVLLRQKIYSDMTSMKLAESELVDDVTRFKNRLTAYGADCLSV